MIEAYGALRAEGMDALAQEMLDDITKALGDGGWEQFDAFWASPSMPVSLGVEGAGKFWKGVAMLVWSASREKLVMGADYQPQPPKFLANGAIQTRP